ncbi:amidohydrolase family protein [Bradyrhizobium sp. 179]|uniref:amidohydrolase family protein n=1 Tax=Bradyrhizobium sp. 179 TaxID=2782648 RepID=UPI001FF85257|nr:amidohydrolase family protein [Bradyrhizobium sp. 179]MCK1541148.1 amidohydrolase family protein [Bradyrhizobium sp. 179]
MIVQDSRHPSRRDLLGEAAVLAISTAAAAMTTRAQATESSPKLQFPPAGATDCHVHVFEPGRFPYAEPRTYTPGTASVEQLQSFRRGLEIDRLVLVQPSVYGDDNRCLLNALRELGSDVARGVAVIDPTGIADADLRTLKQGGVVGVRVNLNVKGEDRATAAIAAVSKAISRVAPVELAVQVYVDLPLVESLAETFAASPVPVILDHYAGADAARGLEQPGFAALLRLLDTGKVWIKLSAPYRASRRTTDYDEVALLARTLIAANPDRLVWASDWPHTGGGAERRERKPGEIEPFRPVDDAHLLSLLSSWTGDATALRKILVDNPARLYGF